MSTNFIVGNALNPNLPLPNFGFTSRPTASNESAPQSQLSEEDMRTYLNQRREFEKMEQFTQNTRTMLFAPMQP